MENFQFSARLSFHYLDALETMMAGQQPELRAYAMTHTGSGDQRRTSFDECGAAWRTEKGNLRIKLKSLPLSGEIILLRPKDKPQSN